MNLIQLKRDLKRTWQSLAKDWGIDFNNKSISRIVLINKFNFSYLVKLPEDGLDEKAIIEKLDSYMSLGNYKWKEGFVSGSVYNYDNKLVELVTKVYGKTAYTNPLHPDVFPGVCKMEAEVRIILQNKYF